MNAQKWAKIFGIVFILLGILGFIPGVTTADGYLLGIFKVDAVHNIIHLLTGIIALAVMKSASGSKSYFKIFGIIYALVAIIGLFSAESILGIFQANLADDILHIVIAVVALMVGFKGGKGAAAPEASMDSMPPQGMPSNEPSQSMGDSSDQGERQM